MNVCYLNVSCACACLFISACVCARVCLCVFARVFACVCVRAWQGHQGNKGVDGVTHPAVLSAGGTVLSWSSSTCCCSAAVAWVRGSGVRRLELDPVMCGHRAALDAIKTRQDGTWTQCLA